MTGRDHEQHSDLDALESPPGMQSVIDALLRLEKDLQTEAEEQGRRADLAEIRLADAEARADEMRHLIERMRADNEARLSDLASGISTYLAESGKGQQVLLTLVKSLLGGAATDPVDATPDPRSEAGAEAQRSHLGLVACDERDEAPDSESEQDLLWSDGEPSSSDPNQHGEEATDEHRLIDLSNRLDMGRLDSPSFVRSFRAWR